MEPKRRFNGPNDGSILSQRQAAGALNVNRDRAGPCFEELEQRGFLCMMQRACLGRSGIGQSALWALDEGTLENGHVAPKCFPRRTPSCGTGGASAPAKKQDA